MYTDFFKLTGKPFLAVPDPTACVLVESMRELVDRCTEGIKDAAGPILIVGPSGSGKSMLLSILQEKYSQSMKVVNLNCSTIQDLNELFQRLLYELGLPFEASTHGESRLRLLDHLKSTDTCPHGMLLLVDEAHTLSFEVLEELRLITNLIRKGSQIVQLVLAGNRPLEERLGHPQMESINQRIAVRCYLEPMTRSETLAYVLGQLQMFGRDGREIFQPTAIEKIHDITDGIPRLISQVCHQALKMAAANGQQSISEHDVQRAWCDLQQLPFQGGDPQPAAPLEAIEFGSLDETAGDLPDTSITDNETNLETDDDVREEPESSRPEPEDITPVQASDEAGEPVPSETDLDAESLVVNEPTLDDLLLQLNAMSSDPVLGDTDATDDEAMAQETRVEDKEVDTAGQDTEIPKKSQPAIQIPMAPQTQELFGDAFETEENVADPQVSSEVSKAIEGVSTIDVGSPLPLSKPHVQEALPPADIKQSNASHIGNGTSAEQGGQQGTPNDDRDILMIKTASAEPSTTTAMPPAKPVAAPANNPVVRMEYEELFRQLRNQTPNE